MTNPETPSTTPVAWCRSDDFSAALQKVQSFSGWREQHPDCDMALYAQPWASAAPDADQAEGPSLDDVAELCAEFEYHIDSDDHHSIGILRDMITAAITRWRAPVAEPPALPLKERPDFLEGYRAGFADGGEALNQELYPILVRINERLKGTPRA